MEKIIKLEGMEYDTTKHIYFLKKFEDGVYVCKADWMRGGKKKNE